MRGFWGDIIQSPYVPFGIEIWREKENEMFKKQINYQHVYVSQPKLEPSLANSNPRLMSVEFL